MLKSVIFDFDGTLVNSYNLMNRVYYEIIKQYDIDDFTRADIETLRTLSAHQIFKKYHLSNEQSSMIIKKAIRSYHEFIKEVPFYPNVFELLVWLEKLNIDIYVLSSNDTQIIKDYIDQHDCFMFKAIYGNSGLFKKHRSLEKLIKKHGYQKHEVLYIGDETRDIEACKRVNVAIAAVTWGFDHKELLKSYHPDYLVDRVDELKDLLLKKLA